MGTLSDRPRGAGTTGADTQPPATQPPDPQGGGLFADVVVRRGEFELAAALRVGAGETVAVVGPNGAGKSTLLGAVAGLVPVSSGAVRIDGAEVTRLPPERRPVGVVFQDRLLFPHLSVLDNVAFGLRHRRGLRRRRARAAAAAALAAAGLGEFAHRAPAGLSGGEAQRVALVRALVCEPDVLLLDEPFAGLDAGARREVRRAVAAALASFGGAAVVVTHDPLDVLALADRVVVLEAGRVVQQGAPAEVRARPRSRYVAEFVGVNLLAGRAQAGTVALDGGGRLVVPGAPDGEVRVVIHPRAVAVHRERPAGSPRNVWPGRVASIDDEGDRVRVAVTATPAIVAEVTPAAARELGLVPGAAVWVAVKATEVHADPA